VEERGGETDANGSNTKSGANNRSSETPPPYSN
jgi:hypothetical protein